MKRLIKKALRRLKVRVTAVNPARTRMVELPARRHPAAGNVLLAYVIDPFLLAEDEVLPADHTKHVESKLLAEVFLGMGYAVDVVDYEDRTMVPKKRYDILVSSRMCLQRYAELLGDDCLKILHATVSHWLDNNAAALARCAEVKRRRGVALRSCKMIDANMAAEGADFHVYLSGNGFLAGTYAYAGKPHACVPLCTHGVYPSPEGKDFGRLRRNFVWMGSHGLVHKGLDLVLEAFARMPEFQLYVCGPVGDEKRFEEAYRKELYQTPNIETVGWVDVTGAKFRRIVDDCVGMVYPSCAEGSPGAVLTCMQAGLIPVTAYSSCIDISGGRGFEIGALTVEAVQETVAMVAAAPAAELRETAMRVWRYARENHTHDRYIEEYRKAVGIALATARDSRT